jgi:hypothetical protein
MSALIPTCTIGIVRIAGEFAPFQIVNGICKFISGTYPDKDHASVAATTFAMKEAEKYQRMICNLSVNIFEKKIVTIAQIDKKWHPIEVGPDDIEVFTPFVSDQGRKNLLDLDEQGARLIAQKCAQAYRYRYMEGLGPFLFQQAKGNPHPTSFRFP